MSLISRIRNAFRGHGRRATTEDDAGFARPGFIIIGAQKGGTTFLFNYLARHPNLRPALEKEVRFFNQDVSFGRGQEWYHRFFPPLAAMRPGDVAFEASPNYLFSATAPGRIASYEPRMKLVAILRDPVERAYSAWNMYRHAHARAVLPLFPASRFDERVRRHVDQLLHRVEYPSFETAIEADVDNAREEVIECDIVRVGYYAEQLSRYLRHFSSEQLLVLSREELLSDRKRVSRTITDFLELPLREWPDGRVDQSGIAEYEATMSDDARERLRGIYGPHNEKLYRLLGRDLGWQS